MAKYKTVKRKAEVGERILVVDALTFTNAYENGEVLTVRRTTSNGVYTKETHVFVYHHEYEAIVEETHEALTVEQAAKSIEDIMRKVRREGYAEGYRQGKFDGRMSVIGETPDNDYGDEETYETAQEARDRIVDRAKADIDGLKDAEGLLTKRKGFKYGGLVSDAEFVVNKGKRTVVCLLKEQLYRGIRAKGIAKCAPDDCFNAHIGKAIALRRALGLEVPDEYLNAPQPTEVRVGDVLKYPTSPVKYTVFDVGGPNQKNMIYSHRYPNGGYIEGTAYGRDFEYSKIIDDSRIN